MDKSDKDYRNLLNEIKRQINLRLLSTRTKKDICNITKDGCVKYKYCRDDLQIKHTEIKKHCWIAAERNLKDWCDYDYAVQKPYGIFCKQYKGFYMYECPPEKQADRGKKYRNCAPPCPYYGCVTPSQIGKASNIASCPFYQSLYFRSSRTEPLHNYYLLYCYLTSDDFIDYQTNCLQMQMGLFAFLDFYESEESPQLYYLVKHILGNCHFYFSKFDEGKKEFVFDEKEHLKLHVCQFVRDIEDKNHKWDLENRVVGNTFFTSDGIMSFYCFAYLVNRIINGGENLNEDNIVLNVEDMEKSLIELLYKYGMGEEYLKYIYGDAVYVDNTVRGVSWHSLLRLLGFIDERENTTERFYRFLHEGLQGKLEPSESDKSKIEGIRYTYNKPSILNFETLKFVVDLVRKHLINLELVQKECPFAILSHLCLRAYETTSRSHVVIPILEMKNQEAGFFLGTVKDTHDRNVNGNDEDNFSKRIWNTDEKIERISCLEELINEVAKAEIHDPYYSIIFERGALQKGKVEAFLQEGGIKVFSNDSPAYTEKIPGYFITQDTNLLEKLALVFDSWAKCDIPILIIGETGTGKELVARGIHYHSLRKKCPFLPTNISSIPEKLRNSAIFGSVASTFTDARKDMLGHLQRVNDGTYFMDEIGLLTEEDQDALLRVIETKIIQRAGDNPFDDKLKVNVRFVFATDKIEKIKKPLLHRISSAYIMLTPLRERIYDIPILTEFYIRWYCNRHSKMPFKVEEKALNLLMDYEWPGNVREFAYLIEIFAIDPNRQNTITKDIVEKALKTRKEINALHRTGLYSDKQKNSISAGNQKSDTHSLCYICEAIACKKTTEFTILSGKNFVLKINEIYGYEPHKIIIGVMYYMNHYDHKVNKEEVMTHRLYTHMSVLGRKWPYLKIFKTEKQGGKFNEILKDIKSTDSIDKAIEKFEQNYLQDKKKADHQPSSM